METQRRTSKGGFFQLFDWKSKSRKNLFLNKFESADTETSRQGKQNVVKSLDYLQLMEAREDAHGRTGKINGDYIPSSVPNDDGCGTKVPGVVARLMGLDCLPTSAFPEPGFTSFCDPPFSFNSGPQRGSSNFQMECHIVNNIPSMRRRGNIVDPRSQKVQNLPMERFQSEMLPPKSAKRIAIAHRHRLLSPIKNPGFIPTNDLAYIVEASSKIMEQCPQSATKSKALHFASSSIPMRICDVRERMEAVPRASGHPETLRRPKEHVSQHNGRPARKKNHSTNNVTTSLEGETSSRLMEKGKSVSLTVQTKVNVQRKEGFNSSDSRRSANRKGVDEVKNGQNYQGRMTLQRSVQKRNDVSRTAGVLKQNTQKQNCASTREKLPPKPSVPIHQNRKSQSVNDSIRPVKGSSKVLNSGGGSIKVKTMSKDIGKEIMSSKTKCFCEKKPIGIGNMYFEDPTGDNITSGRVHNRLIKCNIMHDDCSNWDAAETKSSMDVVSFTFTSPIKKTQTVSGSSGQLMENGILLCDDINYIPRNPTLYSPRSNGTGGDALSVLLEQKLKELTCQVESSHCNFDIAGSDSSSFNIMNTAATEECIDFVLRKTRSSAYDIEVASFHGPSNGKWKGLQEIEGQTSGNSNSEYGKETDRRNAGPMSSLEPSSSDGSYDSSDLNSISITAGCKQFHLIKPHEMVNWISSEVSQPLQVDLDFLDSTSSSSVAYISGNSNSPTISLTESKSSENWVLEYITKILFSSDLILEDLVLGQVNKVLNPNLFNHLENLQTVCAENEKEYFRLERKVLFDCVGECLDLSGEQLLGGNCKMLSKWETLFRRNEVLAEDLWKEISSWTSVEDLMVDELVDKDMSSAKGKWVDFETEAFEEVVEIEKAILSSLVDELVGDFLSL